MSDTPVAIITGAGSGIGRATAIRLAHDGYALVLVGRRHNLLEQTAELCDAPEVMLIAADLEKQDEAEGVIDATVSAFERLDVLVNNAGHGLAVPIERTKPDLLEKTLRINTLAPAWMMLRAWPTFVRQRRGCIINVGSMAAVDPYPGFFAYAASKAALSLMTVSAAKEGVAKKIRAFCIAPGATETPMLRASFDLQTVAKADTQDPADVAETIAKCIAGGMDDANGQTIPVLPATARAWLAEHTKQHPSAWLRLKP